MKTIQETLNELKFRIKVKSDELTEVREAIKDSVHKSATQLLILRRRRDQLLKMINEMQITYDTLNPDNK